MKLKHDRARLGQGGLGRTLAFLLLGMTLGVPRLSVAASAAVDGPAKRPEVVAVYYPHWHNYTHGTAWKGEGWTEWEGVKAAVPRFPGHHQPLQPTWGCFDESDPQWSAREIDLAAGHGVDVFLYAWTEGDYLLPEAQYGEAPLEAIRRVFGRAKP